MTSHGQPDGPRSARYILKDYVNGRLLYCHAPPVVDSAIFNRFSVPDCKESDSPVATVQQEAAAAVKVGGCLSSQPVRALVSGQVKTTKPLTIRLLFPTDY